jgi:hypothetical protein
MANQKVLHKKPQGDYLSTLRFQDPSPLIYYKVIMHDNAFIVKG